MNEEERLEGLLAQAWASRRANFPPTIEFDYPKATGVVSTTGKACALDCAHCGGHYLEDMLPIAEALRRAGGGGGGGRGDGEGQTVKSWLISGGCDREGRVPFWPHLGAIEALGQTGRLNFHVGLVGEEEAALLGKLAATVSFDFVVDDETIHEVFGLDKTGDDYVRSYLALRRHAKVLPHVLIGIKGGVIAGERRILDKLEELGLDGLVFIVFDPTPGTRYADRQPPDVAEAAAIIAEARIRFSSIPISLGCMRPRGRYRSKLDQLAVRAGVNKIVQPTPGARRLAAELGLAVTRGDECCVL